MRCVDNGSTWSFSQIRTDHRPTVQRAHVKYIILMKSANYFQVKDCQDEKLTLPLFYGYFELLEPGQDEAEFQSNGNNITISDSVLSGKGLHVNMSGVCARDREFMEREFGAIIPCHDIESPSNRSDGRF